jgi:hypothetical protein
MGLESCTQLIDPTYEMIIRIVYFIAKEYIRGFSYEPG